MAPEPDVFTIGVEEEFQIIDPRTYALSPDVEEILPLARKTLGEIVQYELILSQVEVATPICHTLADVQHTLTNSRRVLIDAAASVGKCIAAAGTHPFSAWQNQVITPKERYRLLVDSYQQQIKEQVIFGCHVHIGINGKETALEVMNRSRIWLSLLLALSANSPFWNGSDTKYSSYRTELWWSSPLAGPPPLFVSRREHDAFVRLLVATRSIEDATRIYWDIRLPERYETIEFRVMDVCMTVDEAVMLAGLIRALVRTCYEATVYKQPFPEVRPEFLRVANWRAARYGLDNELIDVVNEHIVPARELLERFLAFLRPALEAEGDWELISRLVEQTIHCGNGARRQREIFSKTHKVEDVVQYIVNETAKGSSAG